MRPYKDLDTYKGWRQTPVQKGLTKELWTMGGGYAAGLCVLPRAYGARCQACGHLEVQGQVPGVA
jgi:hypothetical protein